MKTLKISLLALFMALGSHVFGELTNRDLDDLILAVREDPENTAGLVEAVVADYPEEVNRIVNRLLATFPDLADEIILGAIRGLPSPVPEDEIYGLVMRAIAFRPALANLIVSGATQAAPGMEQTIILAARHGLRTGAIPALPSGPEVEFDSTLLISPARP